MLSDFPVFLIEVLSEIVLLRILTESGVLSGSTNISSPEKYFGLLRFWLIDPLTGIDIPNDLGKKRCKSNFALKLKFSELLFDFDSRSCNR